MEWRKFQVKHLFDIRIGKSVDGNKIDRTGSYAYVTRKETSNGVDGFASDDADKLCQDCPVITIGNETAKPFVHTYPFFTGTKVNILKPKERVSEYSLLFIATSLEQHKSKYSYAYTVNSARLSEQVILLPTLDDGMPNWNFMSAYMRQEEARLLAQTLPRLERQLADGRTEPIELPSRPWRAYRLLDLFEARRGNQNHMAALALGFTPLISAKKWNNGVKDFVEAGPRGVFPRHCITLNNDGDGGAGLAFYQPFAAAVDSHVTVLLPRERVGRGALLFAVRCISAQRAKYGHGYSISRDRLRGFRLMLPAGEDGNPNWDFMEAYMRREELEGLARGVGYFKGKRK